MFIPESISFDRIGQLATDGILTYPNIVQTIYVIGFIAILMILSIGMPKNSIDYYNSFKPKTKYAVVSAILFSISVIHISKAGAFIYFNF